MFLKTQAVSKKPDFKPTWRARSTKEKSENFNSLRPIFFKLCKKFSEGGQIDPPPSRNRVKLKIFIDELFEGNITVQKSVLVFVEQ